MLENLTDWAISSYTQSLCNFGVIMGKLRDIEDVKRDVAIVSNGELEIADHSNYRGGKSKVLFRRVACGHTFERVVANVVRVKVFSCPECHPEKFTRTEDRLRKILADKGIELESANGKYGDRDFATVKLECGCSMTRQIGSMLANGARCEHHTDGYRSWKDRSEYEKGLKTLPYGSFEIVGVFRNPARVANFKCDSCGHIECTKYTTLVSREGKCKNCFGTVKSIREQYLAILLEDLKVEFVREFRFEGYLFDFYLPKYNTLIEYDGEQHFLPIGAGLFSAYNNDEIKNAVASKNGFNLLRIHHKESIVVSLVTYLRKFNDYPKGVGPSGPKCRTPELITSG